MTMITDQISLLVCYNNFATRSLFWPSLFINTCSVSSAD